MLTFVLPQITLLAEFPRSLFVKNLDPLTPPLFLFLPKPSDHEQFYHLTFDIVRYLNLISAKESSQISTSTT